MKLSIFGVILIAVGALSQYPVPFQEQIPPLPPNLLPPPPPPPPPYSCYTPWMDRGDPVGLGDYETLTELRAEYPGMICPSPLSIDVQTVSGIPALSTGQVFQHYDTVNGFVCLNAQQGKGNCMDYKVRFLCPCKWNQGVMPVYNVD